MLKGRGAGLVFLAVGIVVFLALIVSAGIVRTNEQRKADWPVTDGEVVDVVAREHGNSHNRKRNRSSGTTYAPVVRYRVDGQEYLFTSSTSTGRRPEIGRTVEVRYNPDDPNDADLASGSGWVVWLLGGMGVVFLGAFGIPGLVLLRSARRRRSEHSGPIDPRDLR